MLRLPVLGISERSAASLQQAEGLRIRAIEAMLEAVGPARRQALLTASRAFAATLEDMVLSVRPSGPDRRSREAEVAVDGTVTAWA